MTVRRPVTRSTKVSLKLVAGSVMALGLLTACGSSAVDSGELEDSVTEQLTPELPEAPESIECPDDLDAEEGAETTCLLTTPDGQEFDTAVTVTSVEDNTVNFDIQVADEPNG